MNLILVFLFCLAVRTASVFVVKTFYVPDEYWQSLEVAHKITFGYGYLTWEWVEGIRSYIYPVIIAGIYKILALLSLDTVKWLIILPRLLQATLSAYSDYRFFIWTGKKKWGLFLMAVSWFWFYTGSRTLSNTLETSLTTIALSYFPWNGEGVAYLWPAALCVFLRPTAMIIWLPLVFYHLHKSKLRWTELVFKRFIVVGLLVAAISVGIDSYMHGRFLITPYEFLKYNVIQNIGSFYGSHPWYWYFTVGLPTVLGINFLPFLFGTIETIRHSRAYPTRKYLLLTVFLSLIILSTVEHKEFRFVCVLLPLCLYIASDTLTRWSYKASRISLWFVAILIIVGNAIPAWYLSTIHQRGPIDVMTKLNHIASEYKSEQNRPANILFLMPCHSTPYYSHIHQNVTMRFLTCEPNLKDTPNYKDEAELFFESPVHWLRSHIPSYPRSAKPSHVVLYEPLADTINEFLVDYKLLEKVANAEYINSRTGRNILIYQRLRDGEENKFNRNEFRSEDELVVKYPDLAEFKNIDGVYDEVETEHNLFN
ncbi:LOW QUALITY PROTEIN: GPI mannosyltransferase 3-like [Musca domestica]|uniref:Mannosyltransferase n=1 Tax=Musca domestica TaxID=7370 RepID=A0A9J7CMB1_MUSDO|nr:GPI mannosyltransferase 3 isoform X2 [Musca domestica]XP_058975735.1 LOW QUALITY PROTEIN: GPI mannosyltransferase 3-like [Musca domestica]